MKIEDILKNENLAPFLDALAPYLPALARMAEGEIELFIQSVLRNEWPEADAVAVSAMTSEERDALCAEGASLAFHAAMKQIEDVKVAKEVALRLLIAAGTVAIGLL